MIILSLHGKHMKPDEVRQLTRFASKYMPRPVPKFSFSDSKTRAQNFSTRLPPKESDNGPQFPHLSKGKIGL